MCVGLRVFEQFAKVDSRLDVVTCARIRSFSGETPVETCGLSENKMASEFGEAPTSRPRSLQP